MLTPAVSTTATDTLLAAADSVYMAPTQVRQLHADTYEDLSSPVSSLDLQNPDNVKTEVEYQPATGYYIIHTKIENKKIATPYHMTAEEYNQ